MTSVHKIISTTRNYQSSLKDQDVQDARKALKEAYNREEKRKLDLPISRGGRFFEDPSYGHARGKFDAAMRDVLRRWGDRRVGDRLSTRWDDTSDSQEMARKDLDRYRKLRERDLKEDNQAIAVTTDTTGQKIVLDVYDFLNGDVRVDLSSGGCDVVVEGVAKRHEGTKLTTITFVRRFPLSPDADPDSISANMTSDGIMLITVPNRYKRPRLPEVGVKDAFGDAFFQPAIRVLSHADLDGPSGKDDLLLSGRTIKEALEGGRPLFTDRRRSASAERMSKIELADSLGTKDRQARREQKRAFGAADSLLTRSGKTRWDLEMEFEDDKFLSRPSRFLKTKVEYDTLLDKAGISPSDEYYKSKLGRGISDKVGKEESAGELERWWKDYQRRMRTTPRESEMSRISTSSSGRIRPSYRDWLY